MPQSLSHFSYLLSDSGPRHTKIAADRLELLAKIAAKHYLESKVPLNDSIKKIAQENDLNQQQIERICEMANIATHQGLWQKTANKESVAFPLADSKNIVSVVVKKPLDATDPDSPMVSSPASSDFTCPPKGIPTPGPGLASLMGADPAESHNGLTEEPEKKTITIIMQKKAAERADLHSRVLMMGMELETLEKAAFAKVKQEVMQGASFRDIYDAAVGLGLGKTAERLLPDFEERLIGESIGDLRRRLEKNAISKAPPELISDDLGNTTVINGAHPVLVSLDTVQKKTGEIKNGIHNLLRIDDEIKVFKQKLRELS